MLGLKLSRVSKNGYWWSTLPFSVIRITSPCCQFRPNLSQLSHNGIFYTDIFIVSQGPGFFLTNILSIGYIWFMFPCHHKTILPIYYSSGCLIGVVLFQWRYRQPHCLPWALLLAIFTTHGCQQIGKYCLPGCVTSYNSFTWSSEG